MISHGSLLWPKPQSEVSPSPDPAWPQNGWNKEPDPSWEKYREYMETMPAKMPMAPDGTVPVPMPVSVGLPSPMPMVPLPGPAIGPGIPDVTLISNTELTELRAKARELEDREMKLRRLREDYYAAMFALEHVVRALEALDMKAVINNLKEVMADYEKHRAWLREIGQ
jgi:hypothetical protein